MDLPDPFRPPAAAGGRLPGPGLAVHGYDARIDRLMARLARLRRRLHAPACTPSQARALRGRMAWLHAAIFAISAEIDCGY